MDKTLGGLQTIMESNGFRAMSYSRFTQYVHFFHPEITLTRPKEDECDGCFAIATELSNPDISEERKLELQRLQQTHLSDAIVQRRAMQGFIKQYVKKLDTAQVIPDDFIPDILPEDDEENGNGAVHSKNPSFPSPVGAQKVNVQAEDCGGGLAFPHFGYRRPSLDYYASNLIVHSFVVSDVVRGVHKIYYFDERGQGKGADALCTLRMKYHLEKLDVETPAQFSVSILDNCVGQNKSQVMMKFYCMLGLCFYETVGCVFLISGHSHMLPDRATSHAKRALKLKNVWHPNQLINLVQGVKNLEPEFLNHNLPKPLFFIGWDHLLDKYFTDLPGGYTNNFFFEFKNGVATVRALADTPDAEAWQFIMCDKPEITRKAILRDLFGSTHPQNFKFSNIQLPRHPGIDLTEKKILSIAEKYCMIPPEHLDYYPALPSTTANPPELADSESDEDLTIQQLTEKGKKKRRHQGATTNDKKTHKLIAEGIL